MHCLEYGFLRHRDPLPAEEGKDTPMPVCAFGIVENRRDGCFQVGVLVCAPEPSPMVIKR